MTQATVSYQDVDDYDFRDPAVPLTDEQRFFRREALAEITAHPEAFSMIDWVSHTECGTTMCLAGTVQWIRRGKVYPDGIPDSATSGWRIPPADEEAVALLGLTEAEYHDCDFRDGLWFTHEADALARLRKLAQA